MPDPWIARTLYLGRWATRWLLRPAALVVTWFLWAAGFALAAELLLSTPLSPIVIYLALLAAAALSYDVLAPGSQAVWRAGPDG